MEKRVLECLPTRENWNTSDASMSMHPSAVAAELHTNCELCTKAQPSSKRRRSMPTRSGNVPRDSGKSLSGYADDVIRRAPVIHPRLRPGAVRPHIHKD